MNPDYVGKRITALRNGKHISECQMSLELGHSKSYIQGIASGRTLPSLKELFLICDYLGVTLKDFFDPEVREPELLRKLHSNCHSMSQENLQFLISMTEKML